MAANTFGSNNNDDSSRLGGVVVSVLATGTKVED
jgi:hypothetical protein